jgi:hypothetical protein
MAGRWAEIHANWFTVVKTDESSQQSVGWTWLLLHPMEPVFCTGDRRGLDCTAAQLAMLNGGQI